MKCINKKKTGLFLLPFLFLCTGCGQSSSEISFTDTYDIYETSKKYEIISAEDTSLQNTTDFFGKDLCVSDGIDFGTDSTDSQVAGAAGVFNLNTKEVTYAQNIYGKMYPASTTKILTAYVALKYGNLDDVYQVSANAADQAEDSSVCHLKEGDYLSLHQLLYGLIMQSGNDAAIAIAEGISGDVETFAELMNQEAKALGAVDSHFINPNGLHDENHYTTVYDLYLIFQAAVQNETFLELIQTKEYTVDYLDSAGMSVQQVWMSTNKYLMETEKAPGGVTVIGGKTGTTNDAGYCLVLYSTNQEGDPIISIIMKADCRNNLYYYMNQLLYGFANVTEN